MSLEYASRGRYRRRSGTAWAGFLRASTGNRNGAAEPVQARANKCSGAARAFFPKQPRRRVSARHSAVKTDKNGAFRYSKKSRAVFVACERSEVLTARKCRALQSHAAFWGMRRKNVKHRSNGRYPGTGGMAPTRSALSRKRGEARRGAPLRECASGWRIEG